MQLVAIPAAEPVCGQSPLQLQPLLIEFAYACGCGQLLR